MDKIYVDNAATTKLDNEVLKKMLPFLSESYGNPSSLYSLGRETKEAINEARINVAKVLNCESNEIYFTSGGSESNNAALKCIAFSLKKIGKHIITSNIEHPSVLESCKFLESIGFEISYIDVNKEGIIKLDELQKAIRKDTILISIMFANNEIGTIQPIEEIGKIAHKNNIVFHTDSVQAVGSLNIDVKKMNIDLLSMSAHKFYGPKGVGALYINKKTKILPYINGGHQENNMRAGTENVASIVGLGEAIKLAYSDLEKHNKQITNLREYYFSELEKIINIKINGDRTNRLPGNTNVSIPDIDSEALIYNLDKNNICASSGSACNSGTNILSHVLQAIGSNEKEITSSVRITFGKYNTKEEIDIIIKVLKDLVSKLSLNNGTGK